MTMRGSMGVRPLAMRSALANRKMFQGGGMVPMGNPMANMQPRGILASSQPLVDAVASDILNPQGGATLSMADGGIARLQRGGSAFMIGEAPSALQSEPYVHPFEEIIANPLPEIVSDVPGAGLPAYLENIIEGGDVTAFQEPGPVKRKDDEEVTEFLPGELTLEEAMEPGFDPSGTLPEGPSETAAQDAAGAEPVTQPEWTSRVEAWGDVEAKHTKEVIPTSARTITEWLADNPDKSSAEVPADAVNNSVDSIFTDALEALEGKKFDVNAFKNELETLIPKAEKDPEMEGLLMLMLGASILGGTSPHWAVNVGEGIEKGMPAIINFKNKQKEDQRAREMTIAKLAIETKLSREQETRTAIRGIAAEKRGLDVDMFKAEESARRALEKEQRQTANYMVVRDTTLPGTTFNSNAPEDSVVNIPFDTKMNLTAEDAARLQGLGIPLFEVGKPTISYADIVASTVPATFGSDLKPEDWNRMVENKRATFFAFGTDGGVELDYYMALPFGMVNGITDSFMAENEWASLYLAYDRYRTKFESVGNKLVTLNELAASGKLTGVEGLGGRIGDTMRGLGSVPFAGAIADALLGDDALSAGSKFDVHARLVLAEIAPWILGESGKTISDSDRVRVAQALGYEATLENGVMMIKGFDEQLLKNPASIQLALNEVARTINKYIDMGDSAMAGAMVRFGRLSPDQSKTLLDSLGRPTDIEKKVGERTASTPQTSLGEEGDPQSNYGVQPEFFDLDLTAGGT